MLQRSMPQRLDSPHSPFMLVEQSVCMSSLGSYNWKGSRMHHSTSYTSFIGF